MGRLHFAALTFPFSGQTLGRACGLRNGAEATGLVVPGILALTVFAVFAVFTVVLLAVVLLAVPAIAMCRTRVFSEGVIHCLCRRKARHNRQDARHGLLPH